MPLRLEFYWLRKLPDFEQERIDVSYMQLVLSIAIERYVERFWYV
jgi:hypothetical protein